MELKNKKSSSEKETSSLKRRQITLIIYIGIFACLSGNLFAMAGENSYLCKTAELMVFTDNNDPTILNPKKPRFTWKGEAGAEVYQLVIQKNIVASTPHNHFHPAEELAYGFYETYLKVIFSDSKRTPCLTKTQVFVIGITPPILVSPTMTKAEILQLSRKPVVTPPNRKISKKEKPVIIKPNVKAIKAGSENKKSPPVTKK